MSNSSVASKAPPVPKYKLEPLKVRAIEAPLTKGEIPVLQVEGSYPSQFNAAAAAHKASKEAMEALRPAMLPEALNTLFRHNSAKPWDLIKSVKLQDEHKSVTRITWIAKYSAVGVAAVEALFKRIRTVKKRVPDINDYFCRTMVAEFDSAAFLGPDGRFNRERYDAITKAMERVSQDLGIPNPLRTEKKVIPLPDFDSRRWMDFDEETNAQITEEIPNQINFVPCPKAA